MSTIPGDFGVPRTCKCYAALAAGGPLVPHTITRRGATADDVVIGVKFAGICHSDIHQVKEEWGPATFPMVPGHEIAGHVLFVGANVTKFTVGQTVGIGCMVDSCRECEFCLRGDENYCSRGAIMTYNGKAKYPHMAEYTPEGGNVTYGGYSQQVVVDKSYVVAIPSNLDLAASAPLLCAGITSYSPLMSFNLRPNQKFGVVGLGGLGHMGAKFAVAMGNHTTVISRGTTKKESALNELKVHNYIDSTNQSELDAAAGSLDFILDTVSAMHSIPDLLKLLKTDGKLILVGAPPANLEFGAFALLMGRKIISGSTIGGIRETQEMMDFCGRHNIVCDIELIKASQIDEAYVRTLKSDVKYRFVIDTDTI